MRAPRSKTSRSAGARNVTRRGLPAPAILASGINGRAMEAAQAEIAEEGRQHRDALALLAAVRVAELFASSTPVPDALCTASKIPRSASHPVLTDRLLADGLVTLRYGVLSTTESGRERLAKEIG